MEISLNVGQVLGLVAVKRMRKLATMQLGSDWRRARRYARIGIEIYDDLNSRRLAGRVPCPMPESIVIARRIARNGGK